MTDHDYCMDLLEHVRERSPNKTDQAEILAELMLSPRTRAAFARWIIAKQVPLVGEVT